MQQRKFYFILACFLGLTSGCSEDSVSKDVCGDGLMTGNEVCDAADGIPATCAEFDSTKQWKEGGRPACSSSCTAVTAGTCIEITDIPTGKDVCGDGRVTGHEVCDGSAGVPASCSEFDSTKQWKEGGQPACSSSCTAITAGTCMEKDVCGDGRVTGDEICDASAGISVTCKEFDAFQPWIAGTPGCSDDCSAITAGTCTTAICGDGQITGHEVCDGPLSVPAKCTDFDASQTWTGTPACSSDCSSALGTCVPHGHVRQFTAMNWNILFQWTDWGGREVAPRAQKLTDILGRHPQKPDIISIVEASPDWHTDEITKGLEKIGYVWADNDSTVIEGERPDGWLLSDVLYKKDKFICLEHGKIDLNYADSECQKHQHCGKIYPGKTSAFYAVLEEIETGAQFIQFATHWEANVIEAARNNDDTITNVIGWVSSHELNRIDGAIDSANKIKELREKYPKAHVFYGGDLNTIDLDILIQSTATNFLNFYVKGVKTDAAPITDIKTLTQGINILISTSNQFTFLPDDFIGAHQLFSDLSGLTDARTEALTTKIITPEQDTWTATIEDREGALSAVVTALGIKVIIDYAFYSKDNMTLTGYKAMTNGDGISTSEDYHFVSDHYPIVTTYSYNDNNTEIQKK